ncbi:protein giant-lens [Caerostris extrusa]|uniref:Protein giant-lens n=1 Tax=Caerostris extrusa TaxID=172846 RepID=A0AAV4X6T6_CAEEX|nr:protein giant-lens [Caerostris extrusa]
MHVVQRCSWWMTIVWLVAALSNVRTAMVSRFPLNFRHNHKMAFKIFYQIGNSEPDLPECSEMVVCNILDTYSTPWIERQCRCPNKRVCSMSADSRDGYTIVDKNRQLKLCEPVNRLPTCRYFRDVAWTYTTYPDNTTKQTMHCACPKNSVAYIFKNEAFSTEDGIGGLYFLACSPQSVKEEAGVTVACVEGSAVSVCYPDLRKQHSHSFRSHDPYPAFVFSHSRKMLNAKACEKKMRCQRKEPCRLFTVKKRPDVEEVSTSTLCQCPKDHNCPEHHSQPSVILTPSSFTEQHIRTYSGYCTPNNL